MYVTVAQQQQNLESLALYVKILGDGLRAFLLSYQILNACNDDTEKSFDI